MYTSFLSRLIFQIKKVFALFQNQAKTFSQLYLTATLYLRISPHLGRVLSLCGHRLSVVKANIPLRGAGNDGQRHELYYSLMPILWACSVSTWTPGPIVVVMVILRMYEPLAAAGLAFLIASISAAKLL